MVIQSNMSPKAIAEVWKNTAPIFMKFNVALTDMTLESIIDPKIPPNLLIELNASVGSSNVTCIEGG
jgi:hypothetical protein